MLTLPPPPPALVATGPQKSPPVAAAVIDLRTREGVGLVAGSWRYTDARIVEATNKAPGADGKPGAADAPTHDLSPRLCSSEFEAAAWEAIDPESLERRRTAGKLAMGWYRLDLTIPPEIRGVSTSGTTIILELTVDDYAEVSVNGSLPQVLGSAGGQLIAGWNTPNRVVLTSDARPGETISVAVLAVNGPLSAPPANYVWLRSATLDVYRPGTAWENAPVKVEATVVRKDPAFDAILPAGAVFERLADGFSFVEGPVWTPRADDARYGGGGPGGYLLFSDPNKNVIHRWDPVTGAVSIFRGKSGYTGVAGAPLGEYHQPGSNGLALDPQGRLTICEHGNRRVTRLEPNGKVTVLADRDGGKRLNSPNDLVYRSDGLLFVTDPPFGLPMVYDDPRKELAYSGVYAVKDGLVTLVSTDLKGPNGLALTPDEKRLYIDDWDQKHKVVMRYDVAADGTLSNATTFFDVGAAQGGAGEIALDGLKVDAAGNVYVSGPGGVWVISGSGKHLGTFSPPEIPANFAWGDEDGRTLYMTARTGLYRVRLGIAGAERPAAK